MLMIIKIATTVIALITVVIGIMAGGSQSKTGFYNSREESSRSLVLGENQEQEGLQANTEDLAQDSYAQTTPIPPTIHLSPTPIPTRASDGYSNLVYPGSSVIENTSRRVVVQSSDSVDIITDWYKDVLTSLGLNVNSFVKTNSNGNVLNSLVVAGGGKEYRVEITKDSSEDVVNIQIQIENN